MPSSNPNLPGVPSSEDGACAPKVAACSLEMVAIRDAEPLHPCRAPTSSRLVCGKGAGDHAEEGVVASVTCSDAVTVAIMTCFWRIRYMPSLCQVSPVCLQCLIAPLPDLAHVDLLPRSSSRQLRCAAQASRHEPNLLDRARARLGSHKSLFVSARARCSNVWVFVHVDIVWGGKRDNR